MSGVDIVQRFGVNGLQNALAYTILKMTGVEKFIPATSTAGEWAREGVLFTGTENLVDWFVTGQSNLTEMEYYELIDNAFFNTVAVATMDKTGLDQMVYNGVDKLVGNNLSTEMKANLTRGGLISGIKTVSETIDQSVTLPQYIKLLPHITSQIRPHN